VPLPGRFSLLHCLPAALPTLLLLPCMPLSFHSQISANTLLPAHCLYTGCTACRCTSCCCTAHCWEDCHLLHLVPHLPRTCTPACVPLPLLPGRRCLPPLGVVPGCLLPAPGGTFCTTLPGLPPAQEPATPAPGPTTGAHAPPLHGKGLQRSLRCFPLSSGWKGGEGCPLLHCLPRVGPACPCHMPASPHLCALHCHLLPAPLQSLKEAHTSAMGNSSASRYRTLFYLTGRRYHTELERLHRGGRKA